MSTTSSTGLEIAVIGMAGRFPGARTVEALWRNLCGGVESIARFTADEMIAAGVDPARLADPAYVPAGGVLDDVELFDAAFFGYNAREAAIMDPQHRVFLECAWEALEHAGYDPARERAAIGVYAGSSMNTYAWSNLLHNREAVEAAGEFQAAIANLNDHLATRVSYKLDLRGSSFTVQTACSTSLVAIHLACQSLLSGESDIALAGGVSIGLPQKTGYLYREGGVHAPDGHCRAFDAGAGGMVGGHGVAIVVLKRLEEAIADGDRIWAVVRGTAINNDGAAKVGYTAPSVDGQARVIAAAQQIAGVEPASIGYIETHGTGTPLGDPVEIKALARAFGDGAARPATCAIGSVKTNLGHLDAAAGVTSFIKTVLALEHGQIPPSLHFERPNPELGIERTPFYVNTRLSPWPVSTTDGPRRAGVSSFGIGGTNAHVVLEQAPPTDASGPSRDHQVLVVSARSDEALDVALRNLADRLREDPSLPLADVAYTLQRGRREFPARAAVVCRTHLEAIDALAASPPRLVARTAGVAGRGRVVFMFPGQGAQHAGMGRELYAQEAVFRAAIDRCATVVQPILGLDLRALMFAAPGDADADARLRETRCTQPALFTIEYALARLWMSWGIVPAALIGHSIGEYVAACLADVFSLEDALRLVCARGRLMQDTPAGAMLAVPLPEADVRARLGADLAVAAVNATASTVVSGLAAVLDVFERRLSADGIDAIRLRTSHAFHSPTMDGVLDAFASDVAGCERHAPKIPIISNLTGTWLTDEQARDPHYWARHLRETVRFADGLATLRAARHTTFLEVGPGRTLSGFARAARDVTAITTLPHVGERTPDQAHVLASLGRLWAAGIDVDWRAFASGERRRRVPLPTYPFERRRYWVDPVDDPRRAVASAGQRLTGTLVPAWRRRPLPPHPSHTQQIARTWLLLADDAGVAAALGDRLEREGHRVVSVFAADRCTLDGARLAIRPGDADDHVALMRHLRAAGLLPDAIVHAWSLSRLSAEADDEPARAADVFLGATRLLQALGREAVFAPLRLEVVSTGVYDVTGAEGLVPAHAPLIGLATVAPQEYPNIVARTIDVERPVGTGIARLADQLAAELATSPDEPAVAWRGPHRWARTFEPLPALAAGVGPRLRDDGVYLITGGLGHVGLTMAEAIAARVRATFVLVGRTAAREKLPFVVQARLARLGPDVAIVAGDMGDASDVRRVVHEAAARWGRLDGVIHVAGLAGESAMRSIPETDRAHVTTQFATKVSGVSALADALRGRDVDFVILTSSISTVLGGLGFGAYAGANAFTEIFAARQARDAGVPWVSVAWDGWRPAGAPDTAPGLAVDAGAAALARVLALDCGSQVLVAADDLGPRLRLWINPGLAKATVDPGAPGPATGLVAAAHHPRPALSTAFVAPRTDVERTIAGIWGELLGLDGVGVEDDFFELGGHSLLATQLLSRLRARFAIDLPLRSLFEATTPAAIASRIETLTRERTRVASTTAVAPGIAPGPAVPTVLSSGQRRLWFLDRLEPGSGAYHIPAALRVTGTIDADVLARCLDTIAARHRVLSSRFIDVDGVPMQLPGGRLPMLEQRDLSALPVDTREAAVATLVQEETARPFDLREGPLLRALLLRLADREHVVILAMHHIASDGWSMAVFVRELGTLYDAFVAGRPAPLPELPIQYADFARWQQAWLASPEMQTQLAYWTRRLSGVAPLVLPTDRPRPAVATLNGAVEHVRLDASLAEAVRAFGRDRHATLFMTLVAAFKVLLFRYTGQDDVSVGSPIANRHRPEVEDLIGFFVNTLVVRTSLAGQPGFEDVVTRVREMALEAYAHQDLPFEELVDAINPGRSLSRNPLFQVMFVLQNTPQERLAVPGATLAPLPFTTTTAKFDLTMYVVDEAEGLTVLLEYNRDLFEASSVRRLLGHFERIVRAALDEPRRDIAQLPMLDAAERHEVVVARNATRTGYPRDASIDALFEARVARHPERVAVVVGEDALTYGELDRRATRVAARLRAAGVAPETPVAICVQRAFAMPVGLIGILKAGGAYVPIDPGLPDERVALLLKDAGVRLVLVHEATATRFAAHDVTAIDLDDLDRDAGRPTAPDADRAQGDPQALAYVIYTSGSTGVPKGVCVPHRAVVRLVQNTNYVQLDEDEVLLQFAPLAFDASTFEIWGALLNGGRLVLYPGERPSLAELADAIERHGITTLWLTAGLFHQMVDAHADVLARRRQVIAGGDVLSVARVRELLSRGGCRVINGFGPTENTTFTCCHPMTDPAQVGETVSIGTPIANTTVYVLDSRMDPVPVGVCGELYTGGDGVARGYLGSPSLTAERFVPDPFDPTPGSRLYRTGDQARLLPDGTIEFLGRRDHQVKLRGFRIELGEVETAIRQHPAVQDAVVLVREDRPGDRMLVGYVAAREDGSLDVQALRSWLAERLPDYMVPSRIVRLDALPLTPNGKVDRAALPRPDAEPERTRAFAAPSTPEESTIARMWEELLQVSPVGATDDFFELGGHSLLATQVASRVRDAFGVELQLRALFLEPTVAGVAREVVRLRAEGAAVAASTITARPRQAGHLVRSASSDGPVPTARRSS